VAEAHGDVEEDERLQGAERRLPERVGDEVGAQLGVPAQHAAEVGRLLGERLGVRRARLAVATRARQRDAQERRHRQHEDDRPAGEGRGVAPRDEQAAADERDARPAAAPDGLGRLRPRGDRVVDEVGVQRAVRLVRDEVRDEEDRHDDDEQPEAADDADDGEGHRRERGRDEQERQPAADRRPQAV
jgi:hypothetical protein